MLSALNCFEWSVLVAQCGMKNRDCSVFSTMDSVLHLVGSSNRNFHNIAGPKEGS
jgi:hypothetical protein